MVWVPAVSEFAVTAAVPLVTGAVPRTVAPSVKVMVPVAPVGTVAVKITDSFAAEGFLEEVRVTVGVDLVTVTVVAGDVAGLLFASPGVLAVMGLLPTG